MLRQKASRQFGALDICSNVSRPNNLIIQEAKDYSVEEIKKIPINIPKIPDSNGCRIG